MSPTMKSVKLSEICQSKRGNSAYTRSYCKACPGTFPVYTGTVGKPASLVDFYDYDQRQLTYTTDGANAGSVEVIEGKHSIGGHRAILEPIIDGLVIDYLKFAIEPKLKALVKSGTVPSVTWARIKDIEITYPITQEGAPDATWQKERARRLMLHERRRIDLKALAERIRSVDIAFENHDDIVYTEMPLSACFSYERGRSCTKAFCNAHPGPFPVWSADADKPLGYTDYYDYDGRYLSLSRNGIGGRTRILEGRFAVNEDRFVLVPMREDVDIDYVALVLEPILRERSKGRAGFNGENEFTKISFLILDEILIPFPCEDGGKISAKHQRLIAEERTSILELRGAITNAMTQVLNCRIEL